MTLDNWSTEYTERHGRECFLSGFRAFRGQIKGLR